ncbi:hypothetical protein QA584_18845 [Anaerocolumna sp. AGMB13025]|uniref:hypothetical protein n=1 Tax=Anaerocolumna sp. AGMB13025 TaxID=3039116 RepID=UPI00241FEB67|nr:hypothetical protein [Anaerocolumna sp. AGMB13025]WFR55656.1 hypothetical protein QA584_18845 [Anaerocolumna sp. AGMB13025]
MKYIKKLVFNLFAAVLGFLLLGWGYNIFIGRPITLNHYFSKHNISQMEIFLTNNDGKTLKSKELMKGEIDNYLKQFGSYKIFKPFFRRTFIAKQDNNHIDLHIKNEANNFDVVFPLTDQGGINLIRYTFYPYKIKHKDMYNYLLDLLAQ